MTTIRLESLPDSLSKNVAVAVTDDDQLLIEANTPVVTIFGKTWSLHVERALRTTGDERRRTMIPQGFMGG